MTKTTIRTFTGDGSFGYVHEACIRAFLEETGADVFSLVDHDWSLKNRVFTDGEVIQESLDAAMKNKDAVVKYPGATATMEELQYAAQNAGVALPQTALGKGKSPNAVVRGINGLDASILRPPARSALLIKPLETKWSAETPVEIQILEKGGRKANSNVLNATESGAVSVHFIDAAGKSQPLVGASGNDFNLAKGSPVSVTHVDMPMVEKRIRATFEDALKKGADVSLATKNTVLSSVDAPILKKAKDIFATDYKNKFAEKKLKFHDGLVDDAFAYLLANEWNHGKPLIMLCPDDCYGAQMQQVLAEVKKKGLNYDHTTHQIAVARLSNGYGDEYGGIHFTPPSAGKLVVKDADGQMLYTQEVEKDGLWLIASHDIEAAKIYANRMVDFALNNQIGGKDIKQIYFGFDQKSPSEQPLAEAIAEVLTKRKTELAAKQIVAKIDDPAKIAAQMLTSPPDTGVILALNNLWGDIMADLFPALANNKASYDSLLISDKGFMVETGAGGTAGVLLAGAPGQQNTGMLHTGVMPLNPIAILSGYAHAIRYNGTEAQKRYASQLEEAIDRSLKQGYLTGDLVNRDKQPQLREEFIIKGTQPHAVDTRVFVQAVKVNMLELQGKAEQAHEARNQLAELEKRHDLSHPTPPTPDDVELITKYLTLPPTDHVNDEYHNNRVPSVNAK